MRLVARVTSAFRATYTTGQCSVDVTDGAHTSEVARGLEFGDVLVDQSATRSLSEFEATLFAPIAPTEGSRIRVRLWHSYEGGTSSLRDLWFEARRATDGSILVQKSEPAPLAALSAQSRAFWRLAMADGEPVSE